MSDAPTGSNPGEPNYLQKARAAGLWAGLAFSFGLLLLGYAIKKEPDSLTWLRYLGCVVAGISAVLNGREALKYFRLHREQQAKQK